MTSTIATTAPDAQRRSPFTGADICREAGLTLPDRTPRPVFDDDLWDFTDVIGLPVQMALYRRRFDFTTITDPRWRLVAKELILALLVPTHDAVVGLPRAYRTALQLTSCYSRLYEAGNSSAGSISGALLPSPNSTPISASNTWRSGATSSTPTASSWASKAPVSAALPRR